MLGKHWDGHTLIGPDPIGKIHWRVTRFAKSYFSWFTTEDRYIFYQGLAYWIKGNLLAYQLTQAQKYLDVARFCADYIVESQREDGAWEYPPLNFRKGKLATVEGGWASLALIDAHHVFGDEKYLQAAIQWYDFMVNVIGFTSYEDLLCINYYQTPVGMVPNNATIALWLNAELFNITNDEKFMEYSDPQIRFLLHSQLENGELPYAFRIRDHLFCYQYNSFEFMDMVHYYEITKDERVWQLLEKLAHFLSTGVLANGGCKRDCTRDNPQVNYWAAALAAAMHEAHRIGLGAHYHDLSEKGYAYVLSQQRTSGSFDFSFKDYGLLRDRRSYPRYLSMIFYHLLLRAVDTN